MIEIGENLKETIIILLVCVVSAIIFYLSTIDNKKQIMKSSHLLVIASMLVSFNVNIETLPYKTNTKKKDKSKILPNGLKEFNIDGHKIYAINLKTH